MRWPWASHQTLVDMIQAFGEQQSKWAAQQDAKYEALLAKYHELAMPKTAEPPSAPQPPHAQQERSLTAEIIRQQAKGDPRLAAYLKGFAKQLKDDGANDEEIAMELTQWYSTESGLLS